MSSAPFVGGDFRYNAPAAEPLSERQRMAVDHRRSAQLVLLVAAATLIAAVAGCQADRFNDTGCQSDGQCRADRICHVGRCLAPGDIDQTQTDAGVDAGPVSVAQFLGGWDTELSGRIIEPNGQVSEIEPDSQIIEIREGQDVDLLIDVVGAQGFCELSANLTSGGFALVDEPCEITEGGQTATYKDIDGQGRLTEDEAGGEGIHFTFAATVEFEIADAPGAVIELDVAFEGPRLQE